MENSAEVYKHKDMIGTLFPVQRLSAQPTTARSWALGWAFASRFALVLFLLNSFGCIFSVAAGITELCAIYTNYFTLLILHRVDLLLVCMP